MKITLFKKIYILLLLLIIAVSFFLGQFLKVYLYDALYNTQMVLIFKNTIPTPNIVGFEDIEKKLKERTAPKSIPWETLDNPFMDITL